MVLLYVDTIRKPYSISYNYGSFFFFRTSINTGLFNSQNKSEHIMLFNHLHIPEINMIIKSILRSMGEMN